MPVPLNSRARSAESYFSFAMTSSFQPPLLNDPAALEPALHEPGFAVLAREQVAACSGVAPATLDHWAADWADLPPDLYLKDGGRYRRRRHSSFVVRGDQLEQVPHRPHWQPVEYNALHGGMQRHFEPMRAELVQQPEWAALLTWLGRVASAVRGAQPWFVEAHQFRIDTTDGIGRPTPEGAHRDGVDFVAVFLVAREGVRGGETRVFDARSPQGQRFTLEQPWSLMLMDDARVIHETTPIQPAPAGGSARSYRDTLVITLRAGSFQDEGAA